ncbi:MAG TPA: hypothetical protein DCO83_00880 [Mucilaginibacter sp.]|nr:hypothetical protein [Mucilaginibacter sp.]
MKDTISNNSITISNTLKKASRNVTITPYKLNEDYTVIDTGEYSNGPMGGSYAIIKRNGIVADTIDRGFGIKPISKGFYLYCVLNRSNDPEGESEHALSLDIGRYLMIINNSKVALKNLSEKFDDYFSSPEVINHKIYYWQINPKDSTGKVGISAAEYDPAKKTTKSHFIMDGVLDTDDSDYFPLPYTKNDTIYFDAGKDKLMKFSKDFKSYN